MFLWLMPEVNSRPFSTPFPASKKIAATGTGFIVTKSQLLHRWLVLVLKPLADAFGLGEIFVVTFWQAISGAGTIQSVPAMDMPRQRRPSSAAKKKKWSSSRKSSLGKWDGSRFRLTPALALAPM